MGQSPKLPHLHLNMDITDYINPENLKELIKDLACIVQYGYGEIRIRVQKGSVMGHEIIISKKHPEGSNKKPPIK